MLLVENVVSGDVAEMCALLTAPIEAQIAFLFNSLLPQAFVTQTHRLQPNRLERSSD